MKTEKEPLEIVKPGDIVSRSYFSSLEDGAMIALFLIVSVDLLDGVVEYIGDYDQCYSNIEKQWRDKCLRKPISTISLQEFSDLTLYKFSFDEN